MKGFKIVLLLTGFIFFFILIYLTGTEVIYNQIVTLKWNWILILTPFFFVYIFDTLGWKYSFHKNTKQVNYGSLFLTRLAGEAINGITPSAYMGGEPIKARLLCKKGIPAVETVSSVVIAKTTMTIAQAVFAVVGVILAFNNFALSFNIIIGSMFFLLIIISFLLFIIIQQKKGLFIALLDILKKFNITFFENRRCSIESLDNNISEFYKSQKNYFFFAIILHFIGWVIGLAEVYFIVDSIGVDISLKSAFVIESLFVVIKAIFFIIPGSLGAQEGGTVLLFSTLGFSAPVGLTVGIVKRIREIVWIFIGLTVLAKMELFEQKK